MRSINNTVNDAAYYRHFLNYLTEHGKTLDDIDSFDIKLSKIDYYTLTPENIEY